MKHLLATVIAFAALPALAADPAGSSNTSNGYDTPYSTYSAELLATLPPSNSTVQLTMPPPSPTNNSPAQMRMTYETPPPAAAPTAGSVNTANMGETSMESSPFTGSFETVPPQTATLPTYSYTTTPSNSVSASEAAIANNFGTTTYTEPTEQELYEASVSKSGSEGSSK